jgi:hypothetical protein
LNSEELDGGSKINIVSIVNKISGLSRLSRVRMTASQRISAAMVKGEEASRANSWRRVAYAGGRTEGAG